MYGRLSRFAGLDPEHIEATLRQFQEEALPRLKQEPGFRGITLGVNYEHGQAIALALWESEADLRQSEKLAGEVRDQAVDRHGPVREAIVDDYEVVLQT